MLESNSTAFLVLNASIIWLVLAYILMMIVRSKIIFACLLILPLVVVPSLESQEQISEWMGWYLFSMKYGFVGMILGVVFAQIGQTKRFITNVSKGSFVLQLGARFTIGVAGLYLLAYLLKQVFMQLPFVEVALDYVAPGVSMDQLFEGVGLTGALIGLGLVAFGFVGIIGSRYLALSKTNNSKD